MIEQTSWCTIREKELVKPDKKYLKNVKMTKDGYGRTREEGEIDMSKIPTKLLHYILKNDVEDFRLKRNYDLQREIDYDWQDETDEMCEFSDELQNKFGINAQQDLFKLIKDYLYAIKDDAKKSQLFGMVLNLSCKLKYTDHDGYEYCTYSEHEHPSQKDVNHNYIGKYEFIVWKPIPLKMIETMLVELKITKKGKSNKNTSSKEESFDEFEM